MGLWQYCFLVFLSWRSAEQCCYRVMADNEWQWRSALWFQLRRFWLYILARCKIDCLGLMQTRNHSIRVSAYGQPLLEQFLTISHLAPASVLSAIFTLYMKTPTR